MSPILCRGSKINAYVVMRWNPLAGFRLFHIVFAKNPCQEAAHVGGRCKLIALKSAYTAASKRRYLMKLSCPIIVMKKQNGIITRLIIIRLSSRLWRLRRMFHSE